MPGPTKARAALQSSLVISDVIGAAYLALGTGGTIVAIPAGAHTMMVYADGSARLNIDASATAAAAGILQGSVQYAFGLHAGASSVGFAGAGTARNVYVNWLKASGTPGKP